ncbi:MAG: hypothetical protein Alpg2KO_04920 [Alphaproteobacteria bacterium]
MAKIKRTRKQQTRKAKQAKTPPLPLFAWSAFALLVLATAIAPITGLYSIDEAVYLLQADAVWNHGRFSLPVETAGIQGLRAYQDLSMILGHNPPALYPQYPPFYGILAGPFFMIGGVKGLMLLNLISFAAITLMLRPITLVAGGTTQAARFAQVIFVLCGFMLQYAMAVWPHMFALAIVTGAIWASLACLQTQSLKRQLGCAALSGLILGVGTGIRADALFLLPAIMLPLVFVSPVRVKPLLALLAGLAIPLAILTLINISRFDIAQPVTYGYKGTGGNTSASSWVIPALMLIAATATVRWWVSRPIAAKLAQKTAPLLLLAGVIALLGLSLFGTGLPGQIGKLSTGLRTVVIDVPSQPVPAPDSYEPITYNLNGATTQLAPVGGGDSVTQNGQVVSFGALKKSIIQSLPWLALSLPVLFWLIGGRIPLLRPSSAPDESPDPALQRLKVLPLALCMLLPMVAFSWFNWIGGQAANMRYLIAIVPAASVLAALCLDWLSRGPDTESQSAQPGFWKPRLYVGALALAPMLLIAPLGLGLSAAEASILITPLLLAGLLALCFVLISLKPDQSGAISLAGWLAPLALVHAGAVGFLHDWTGDFPARIPGHYFNKVADQNFPQGAVVIFGTSDGYFLRALADTAARKDLLIFRPFNIKRERERAEELAFLRDLGRPVFASFPKAELELHQSLPVLQEAEFTLIRDGEADHSPQDEAASPNASPQPTDQTTESEATAPAPLGPPNIWSVTWPDQQPR